MMRTTRRWRWPAALVAAGVAFAVLTPTAQATDRPSPVTGIAAGPGDSTGVLAVTWDAHPDDPAGGYQVQVAAKGTGFSGREIFSGTEATFEGLTPTVQYRVRVRAVFGGEVPESRWSKQAWAHPAGLDRPAAVTGVTVGPGDNPGDLVVTWKPHPDNPHKSYRVAIAPVDGRYVGGQFGGGLGKKTDNTFADDAEATIEGLEPGGEYKVIIRARFAPHRPNSEWSKEVTGFAAAEAPVSLKNSNSKGNDGTGDPPIEENQLVRNHNLTQTNNHAEPSGGDCGENIHAACEVDNASDTFTFTGHLTTNVRSESTNIDGDIVHDVDWWGPIQIDGCCTQFVAKPDDNGVILGITGIYNAQGRHVNKDGDVRDVQLHRSAWIANNVGDVNKEARFLLEDAPAGEYYVGVSANARQSGDYSITMTTVELPDDQTLVNDDIAPGKNVNGDTILPIDVDRTPRVHDSVPTLVLGEWYYGTIEYDGGCGGWGEGYDEPDIDEFTVPVPANSTLRIVMQGVTMHDPQLVYHSVLNGFNLRTLPDDQRPVGSSNFDSTFVFDNSGNSDGIIRLGASANECASVNNGNAGKYRIRVVEVTN